ncbi:hypothetical protein ID866_4150 [Astraeus odoratus]|nr:hypothetical protein ID866_4150 [Astraeus odoratus]
MPHVFVIPPEEEQKDNPPWCCFDADEQPDDSRHCPTNPDVHLFHVPCLTQPEPALIDPPISRVGPANESRVTTPRRLEKKQRPEIVRIVENKVERGCQRDVREDSDVIEVVKVKRGKDSLTDPEEQTQIKRSKTFKARATKALQSIKNVGKNSRKQHIKDLWTSSESVPGVFRGLQEQIRQQQEQLRQQCPSSPTQGHNLLSRSNSRSFSHLFQSIVKPPSPTPPPMSPVSQVIPTLTSCPISFPENNTTSPSDNATLSANHVLERPDSPSSLAKVKSKRFSVRELHKIFTFPSSSHDSLPASDTPPSPILSEQSVPASTSTSTIADHPDVPTEHSRTTVHFVDLDNTHQKLLASYHRIITHDDGDDDDYGTPLPPRPRDLSFEMRLDSLHFDSLSFDPEEFNISVDGNIRR